MVREICNRYHREEKLKRVVRLAFLKYASGSGEGLGGESQVVRALVKDMMKQGIHLNCFKGLKGLRTIFWRSFGISRSWSL